MVQVTEITNNGDSLTDITYLQTQGVRSNLAGCLSAKSMANCAGHR